MKLNEIQNIIRYNEIVDRYGIKGCVSNDYIQKEVASLINKKALFEFCTTSNAFLFVKKHFGFRLYYYINDFNEVIDVSNLPDLVTEILYRGEAFYPTMQIAYLEKCGFKKNLIREQYSGIFKDFINDYNASSVIVKTAAIKTEIRWASELFNTCFDRLSGDYIFENDYEQLLSSNSILIAYDSDSRLLGALHQTVDNNVAWLSHVAVSENIRGKGVGKALLEAYIKYNMTSDKSRYALWVQSQNAIAKKMYQDKGFKYVGKSSISLIKN